MSGVPRSTFFEPRQQQELALLLAASIGAALLEMAGVAAIPLFVSFLLDPSRALPMLPSAGLATWAQNTRPATVTLAAAASLAALFLVKNMFLAALYTREGIAMRNIHVAVAIRLFRAYLEAPFTLHLQRNPAELIRNVEAETSRAMEFVKSSMRLVRESLVLLVILLVVLLMDPAVSAFVFITMAAGAGIFYASVRRVLGRKALEAITSRGNQLQAASQGIGAIREARVLRREEYLIERFAVETRAIGEHERYFRLMDQIPRLFLEFSAIGAVLLVTVMFVLLDRPAESMIPMLALLAAAGVRLVPAFNIITTSVARIRHEGPSFRLVTAELDTLARSAVPHATAAGTCRLQKSLAVRDVCYRYPGSSQDVLHDVSLTVRAGEVVGLIGASGAGKSTLVDLILGLLVPTSGTVQVDGRDIHSCLEGWQRQIGYVPQDIYLLDDSIRRNVAFGIADEAIDDHAVRRALETAQLTAFVESLPLGLDTVVGNRGVRLSGGQRQRLGIARALYHEPRVLVLDEATSALDTRTEYSLAEAIDRIRHVSTVIIVAHRLTTVRGCDRLYLMEHGRVADCGRFDELAQRHEHLRVRPAFGDRLSSPVG